MTAPTVSYLDLVKEAEEHKSVSSPDIKEKSMSRARSFAVWRPRIMRGALWGGSAAWLTRNIARNAPAKTIAIPTLATAVAGIGDAYIEDKLKEHKKNKEVKNIIARSFGKDSLPDVSLVKKSSAFDCYGTTDTVLSDMGIQAADAEREAFLSLFAAGRNAQTQRAAQQLTDIFETATDFGRGVKLNSVTGVGLNPYSAGLYQVQAKEAADYVDAHLNQSIDRLHQYARAHRSGNIDAAVYLYPTGGLSPVVKDRSARILKGMTLRELPQQGAVPEARSPENISAASKANRHVTGVAEKATWALGEHEPVKVMSGPLHDAFRRDWGEWAGSGFMKSVNEEMSRVKGLHGVNPARGTVDARWVSASPDSIDAINATLHSYDKVPESYSLRDRLQKAHPGKAVSSVTYDDIRPKSAPTPPSPKVPVSAPHAPTKVPVSSATPSKLKPWLIGGGALLAAGVGGKMLLDRYKAKKRAELSEKRRESKPQKTASFFLSKEAAEAKEWHPEWEPPTGWKTDDNPKGWIRPANERQRKELFLWHQWKEDDHSAEAAEPLLKSVKPIIYKQGVQVWADRVPIQRSILEARANQLAIQGLKKYDPSKAQMNTHLSNQLKGMHRFVTQRQNMTRLTEERRRLVGPYQRAHARLLEKLEREPTISELAEEMHEPTAVVEKLLQEMKADLVASSAMENPFIEETPESQLKLQLLRYSLTPEEEKVFDYLTGQGGKQQVTSTNEIAKKEGWSASKVSQLKNSIMRKWNK